MRKTVGIRIDSTVHKRVVAHVKRVRAKLYVWIEDALLDRVKREEKKLDDEYVQEFTAPTVDERIERIQQEKGEHQ